MNIINDQLGSSNSEDSQMKIISRTWEGQQLESAENLKRPRTWEDENLIMGYEKAENFENTENLRRSRTLKRLKTLRRPKGQEGW